MPCPGRLPIAVAVVLTTVAGLSIAQEHAQHASVTAVGGQGRSMGVGSRALTGDEERRSVDLAEPATGVDPDVDPKSSPVHSPSGGMLR